MSAGSSECNKYPTASLLVIDIGEMVSYGCSTFKGEPGLTLRCLLDFFLHSRKDLFRDEGSRFSYSISK